MFNIHKICNLPKKLKKAIHAIIITSSWCIWLARNDLIFNNTPINLQKLFQEIKSSAYLYMYQKPIFFVINIVELV